MFQIIFQGLDCANARKEKANLIESQKIFDIRQGKKTCRETSTVQMVTIIITITFHLKFFIFLLVYWYDINCLDGL